MTHTGFHLMRQAGMAKRMPSSRAAIACIIVTVLYSYLNPVIFGLLGADYRHYVLLNAAASYSLIIAVIILFGLVQLETLRDHVSLWTIVLGCALSALSSRGYPWIYGAVFAMLGAILSIYIIVNRAKATVPGWRSFFRSLLWSVGAVVLIALIAALLGVKASPVYDLGVTVNSFRFQLAFAAVTEEALFRGVIFNLMRANGSTENTALSIQAILFWGMHYPDIGNPLLFLALVPLATLFMTWIIKKEKYLYSSIVMHTLINVLWALLARAIASHL